MDNKKIKILKSFYPNKFLILSGILFFGGSSIILSDIINNPPLQMDGRLKIFLNLPFIPELVVIASFVMAIYSLLLYVSLESGHYYVKVTDDGIIYSNFLTLFEEKKILWKDIKDFYIESVPNSVKRVRIKFKKYFIPSYNQKNLVIHGNPRKVVKILKDYLSKYSNY